MIDPNKLVVLYDGGTADMADLVFGAPNNTEGRFSIPGGEPFAVVYVRLHFSGNAGTANVAINVDSGMESQFDTLLYTLNARGTSADANFRVPEDQLAHFVFQAGDVMVLTWTNPDTGNITWGAEVALIRTADLAIR